MNFLLCEVAMILLILSIALIVVLVVAGAAKAQVWNSGRYMINSNGLDDTMKFSVISRWGSMG